MADEKPTDSGTEEMKAQWRRPSLKYVGNVNDVFLFPGEGKISSASYDTGDTPFKPKGQDH
jgi:hypothetical protein